MIKFEIKNRWTGNVQLTVEIDCDESKSYSFKLGLAVKTAFLTRADLTGADLTRADLTRADLTDADLTDADLTDADLTDADLTDADLTRADLTGANLTGADLTRADLTDANLTGADLTRADLTRADLTDANLTRADLTDANLTDANLTDANLTRADLTGARTPFVPPVENLDGKILARIKEGGKLKMNAWHTCETTHCRAGWAVKISPVGRTLESIYGTGPAAALIYAASYPREKVPDFYASDEAAMACIIARAK